MRCGAAVFFPGECEGVPFFWDVRPWAYPKAFSALVVPQDFEASKDPIEMEVHSIDDSQDFDDDLPQAPDTPVGLWIDRSGRPRSAAPTAPLSQFQQERVDLDSFVLTHVYAIRRKSDQSILYVGSTHQTIANRFALHVRDARDGKKGIPFHRWLQQDPARFDDLEIVELSRHQGRVAGEEAEYAMIRTLTASGVKLHNVKTRQGWGMKWNKPRAANKRKPKAKTKSAAPIKPPVLAPYEPAYRAVLAASAEARRARRKAARTA